MLAVDHKLPTMQTRLKMIPTSVARRNVHWTLRVVFRLCSKEEMLCNRYCSEIREQSNQESIVSIPNQSKRRSWFELQYSTSSVLLVRVPSSSQQQQICCRYSLRLQVTRIIPSRSRYSSSQNKAKGVWKDPLGQNAERPRTAAGWRLIQYTQYEDFGSRMPRKSRYQYPYSFCEPDNINTV